MMNRRNFLIGAVTAAPVLLGTRYLSANPLGLPIGCQTYPVRKSINTDFAGTMKGLRAVGFTQIELCSPYGYDDFSSLRQYKPQELLRMPKRPTPEAARSFAALPDDVRSNSIETAECPCAFRTLSCWSHAVRSWAAKRSSESAPLLTDTP